MKFWLVIWIVSLVGLILSLIFNRKALFRSSKAPESRFNCLPMCLYSRKIQSDPEAFSKELIRHHMKLVNKANNNL